MQINRKIDLFWRCLASIQPCILTPVRTTHHTVTDVLRNVTQRFTLKCCVTTPSTSTLEPSLVAAVSNHSLNFPLPKTPILTPRVWGYFLDKGFYRKLVQFILFVMHFECNERKGCFLHIRDFWL